MIDRSIRQQVVKRRGYERKGEASTDAAIVLSYSIVRAETAEITLLLWTFFDLLAGRLVSAAEGRAS
jgi:hypothetical protein